MNIEQYDLIVIGGGSAGLVVTSVAAQLGYKVVLLEGHKMGGDCLNYGCVPSKALLSAAKYAHVPAVAKDFGLDISAKPTDMKAVMDHVRDVIGQIAPHDSVERFESIGATVISEFGRFHDKDTVVTDSGRMLTAKRIVVATGSRAATPPIPGLEKVNYLINETIFDIEHLPEHLVVIGGGPIGIEMAQAFVRFGSKVTVLQMDDRILPHDAEDLTDELTDILKAEGIDIITGAMVAQVDKNPKNGGQKDGISVAYKKDGKMGIVHGSDLLLAAGRIPNTEKLDLEKAGIGSERGGITVDNQLRTANKKVFALGDVAANQPNFTHMAGEMATLFIKRVLFGSLFTKARYSAFMPWVTYTDPELAHVGMTEKQAKAEYGDDAMVTVAKPGDVDRNRAERALAGGMRVITRKNGQVLGVSVLAKDGGEYLPIWTLMIVKKMKIGVLSSVIHAYPTRSELNRKAASAFSSHLLKTPKVQGLSRFMFRLLG